MARFLQLTGRVPYEEAHALQRALVEARIAGRVPDTVLLLEHEETITLGRSRSAASNVLNAQGVPVVQAERGGDATWHGPGQLVAYPIVHLEGARADLHLHLHSLEHAVLDLLEDLGLQGSRDPRNTGVWLPSHSGPPRKVCSIGIACRRWVTWHGLGLNVDPDRSGFARINPCGLHADDMTRLVDHLPRCPSVSDLVPPLAGHLARRLELPGPVEVEATTLEEVRSSPW